MTLEALKPRILDRLKKFMGRWVGEVPAILWSLRMAPNRSTGFTPFYKVYGAEAMLPTDVYHGAPKVLAYNEAMVEES